jgi:integrase/recombinase XerD
VVLSPEEVARLFNAAPGLKYEGALSVAYGGGLRASEVISLKVCDIDVRVIQVLLGRRADGAVPRGRQNELRACPALSLVEPLWLAAPDSSIKSRRVTFG